MIVTGLNFQWIRNLPRMQYSSTSTLPQNYLTIISTYYDKAGD